MELTSELLVRVTVLDPRGREDMADLCEGPDEPDGPLQLGHHQVGGALLTS